MDVVVVGARVMGIAGEHAFERADDLGRLGPGLAVLGPEVPRPQVHQRLGEEGLDVEVVGEPCRHLAHRGGVGLVEGALGLGIRRRRVGVARDERLDEGALHRLDARRARERRLRRLVGGLRALGLGGEVDVRAEGHARSPGAARARRIEPDRVLERALRLLQVERVEQQQPLVEVALGAGRLRGDRAMVPAELREIGRRRILRGGAGGGCDRGDESGGESERANREGHGVLLRGYTEAGGRGGRATGGRDAGRRYVGIMLRARRVRNAEATSERPSAPRTAASAREGHGSS